MSAPPSPVAVIPSLDEQLNSFRQELERITISSSYSPQPAFLQPAFSQPAFSQPLPTQSPTLPDPQQVILESQLRDELLNRVIGSLKQGQAYHTVPDEMQVGVPVLIEAGIAPQVTDEIKNAVERQNDLKVIPAIKFDPIGTKLELMVDPKDFDVFSMSNPKQLLVDQHPGRWRWKVTPLSSGPKLITIVASVPVSIPGSHEPPPFTSEVFKATRQVQVNPVYSTSQFFFASWKDYSTSILGTVL